MSTTHQDVSRSGRTTKRVSPAKLAHVVLRVRDLPAMRDWYKTMLQAEVTQESDMLCFLTYDDEHHRIALVAIPGLEERGEVRRVGMDHIAFTYASVGDLFHTYERLRDAGIAPFWPINHGVTLSLYYRDPEGNRIELQVDAFATMDEGKTYMRSDAFKTNPVGVVFDPRSCCGGSGPEKQRRPSCAGRHCRRERHRWICCGCKPKSEALTGSTLIAWLNGEPKSANFWGEAWAPSATRHASVSSAANCRSDSA